MKMESPLEVLSRAASIVQNEDKSLVRRESTDSMSEDEHHHHHFERRTPSPVSPKSPNERRSPKRHHHPSTEKSFKKLKLDDNKIEPKVFERHHPKSEMTTTTFSSNRPLSTIHVSRHSKGECTPPPLIAINDTRKQHYRKLPDYDILFPRPSVIASTTHSTKVTDDYRYQYRCAADCQCRTTTSAYPEYVKKSTISSIITRDFELPTVDDHFRKSLGDKYDFSDNLHERPSSVDDHFAKALGKNYKYVLGLSASS
eukprot:TCONS_00047279-protein